MKYKLRKGTWICRRPAGDVCWKTFLTTRDAYYTENDFIDDESFGIQDTQYYVRVDTDGFDVITMTKESLIKLRV